MFRANSGASPTSVPASAYKAPVPPVRQIAPVVSFGPAPVHPLAPAPAPVAPGPIFRPAPTLGGSTPAPAPLQPKPIITGGGAIAGLLGPIFGPPKAPAPAPPTPAGNGLVWNPAGGSGMLGGGGASGPASAPATPPDGWGGASAPADDSSAAPADAATPPTAMPAIAGMSYPKAGLFAAAGVGALLLAKKFF